MMIVSFRATKEFYPENLHMSSAWLDWMSGQTIEQILPERNEILQLIFSAICLWRLRSIDGQVTI